MTWSPSVISLRSWLVGWMRTVARPADVCVVCRLRVNSLDRVRVSHRSLYVSIVPGRVLRPLVFFSFLMAIGLLSLADRAPDAVKSVWSIVQRIGSSAERVLGLDVIDRGDIPFAFDTLGHLILWSIAGALAFLAFGRRTSMGFLIVSLVTLSAGVELGQGFLSSTRRPELADLLANTVGVMAGVLCAALVLSTFAMVAKAGAGLRRTLTRAG